MKPLRTDWSSAARIRNDAEKGSGAVVADIDILLQRATAGDVTAAWQYGYARLVGEFEHSVKGVIRCRRNRREALNCITSLLIHLLLLITVTAYNSCVCVPTSPLGKFSGFPSPGLFL